MAKGQTAGEHSGRSLGQPQVDALVAVMNNQRDLEIAQRDRWYRIPCRSAPDALAQVGHLAFYHTRVFGPLKWAVHYYAPVISVERARRRELLPEAHDHPRADDLYFRLNLGDLRGLDRPIPSRRLRRIVFIPTTMAKLRNAEEINDLYHESPLEDRL